jgi:hypothetical protein
LIEADFPKASLQMKNARVKLLELDEFPREYDVYRPFGVVLRAR